MKSKRSHEGVLIMDHRSMDGVPEDITRKQGLPVGSGQGLFEAPTFTCSHCPRVVVMNPNRTRERAYCGKCDHYICDRCGAIMAVTKECKTYKEVLEDIQEANFKEEQKEGVIIHG